MKKKRVLRKPSARMTDALAFNIRQFRARKMLSQEDFADLCGLHRTYVGSVERGERNVTLSTLESLAEAMRVSVSELLSVTSVRR